MYAISKGAVAAAVAFGGLAAGVGGASAMPMVDLTPAVVAHADAPAVEQARWVCGPFRCFWRPNYGYGFYRPYGWHRPFYGYGGYGWHRPFYGHGYGWHRRFGGWHRW